LKFLADGMLGKLTHWLRMMGHDVEYSIRLDDRKLLLIAKEERRVLLTRDLELYKEATAKGIDSFFVAGEREQERLAQLSKRYSIPLEIDMSSSRCPKCNTLVRSILKEEIKDKIEKNTYEHYNEFWTCLNCHQIYWQGAHWTKIRETLVSAKLTLKEIKDKK